MISKVRRVDFSADEWLGGTSGLTDTECGIYIRACALIYSRGGPIARADLRTVCKSRGVRFTAALDNLIQLGKLIAIDGDRLYQARCEVELQRAQHRIDAGVDAARARWQGESIKSDLSSTNGVDNSVKSDLSSTNLPQALHEPATKLPQEEPSSAENKYLTDALAMPTKNRQRQEKDLYIKSTLGFASAHARPREGTPSEPPSDEDKAHVEKIVGDLIDVLALPPTGLRNGVARNHQAYREAIAATKRDQWLNNLASFVGSKFDGDARLVAWEAIESARTAGSRDAMLPHIREAVDDIDKLFRMARQFEEAAA